MANGVSESGDIREALDWGRLHPLVQARWYFPFKLYEWQADLLKGASQPHSRAATSTANESGKTSSVLPIFGLSAMVAFPGCRVYSTSGSERQVKEQLFDQQLRLLLEQPRFVRAGWSISVPQLRVTAPNGSVWLGYVCKDALNVEGFHGYWRRDGKGRNRYYPCVYLLDECKSIADPVYEAVKRIDPDFEIAVSTPGKESGWFYDAIDPESLRAETGAKK